MQKLIVLFLLLFGFSLQAQELPKQQTEIIIPDPGELPYDWWNAFHFSYDTAEKRREALAEKLKQVVSSLPEGKQSEAHILIDKIYTNLLSIEQEQKKPLETPPLAPPYRNSYTLDDLINLNKDISRLTLEIKNDKDQRADKEKAIEALTTALSKTMQQYAREPARSPAKTLLGLQIIENKTALENAKLESKHLDAAAKRDTALLSQLEDELSYAESHLASSQISLSKLRLELPRAQEAWNQSYQKLREKESVASSVAAANKSPVSNAENLLFQEEMLETEIQAAGAHNDYLQAQIKYPIAQYLVSPGKVDIPALRISVEQWEALIKQYQGNIREWIDSTQRIIQRLSQTLSLPPQEDTQSKEVRSLQEQTLQKAQANLLQLQRLEIAFDDTEFLLNQLQNQIVTLLGGKTWVVYLGDLLTNFFAKVTDGLTTPLFTVGATSITLLSLLQLLLILLFVWWISRFITTTLSTLAAKRKGIQKSLIYRLTRLIHYFILSLGLIIALATIGFDFSNFVLIAGALGVGLGFGLQSIFNNFISGLIILFESELNVGDYIELDTGVRGEIREIKVRNTIVTTNDGVDILIPNSQLINNRVTNWTLSDPYRSVRVSFTVAYGTDKDLVVKIVKEAAKKASSTLNKIGTPDPKVFLTKLGEYGMEFTLVVWVNERATKRSLAAQSEYLWAIETVLKEYGIEIPYPQYEVRIKEDNGIIAKKQENT